MEKDLRQWCIEKVLGTKTECGPITIEQVLDAARKIEEYILKEE